MLFKTKFCSLPTHPPHKIFLSKNMTKYIRFRVNCYLKVTCYVLYFDIFFAYSLILLKLSFIDNKKTHIFQKIIVDPKVYWNSQNFHIELNVKYHQSWSHINDLALQSFDQLLRSYSLLMYILYLYKFSWDN